MHSKEKAMEKLEYFKTLNYSGWNGYDAEPISEKVINKALDLVKQLVPTPNVSPTGRNSIQLDWETDDKTLYLEMEIFEDRIEVFNQTEHRGGISTIDII